MRSNSGEFRSRLAVWSLVLGLVLSACSGDDGDAATEDAGGQAGAGSGGAGQAGKGGGASGTSGHGGQAGAAAAGQGGQAGGAAGGAGGDDAGGAGGADAGAAGEGQGGAGPGGSGTGGTGTAGMSGGSGQAGKGGGTSPGPTCQKAGGDRCGKTKDDCAGLVNLASSDCVSCCQVPGNPVMDVGFADPYIVRDGDTYYAFATGGSVLRRTSKDLVTWKATDPALTKSPWKQDGAGFWAPTVYKAKSGKWVLYYAAETGAAGSQHCIGKATSAKVDGTFTAAASKIICPAGGLWAIDPSVFRDSDGKDYLLWRQDTKEMSHGNVFISRIDDNGDLTGSSHEILSRASKEPSWEFDAQGGVMENPAMVRHGSTYHLFYSANRWETAKYGNGHATCTAPFGPCKKTSTTDAWQGSKGKMKGPGGADTVKTSDGTLLMYMHGWEDPHIGPDDKEARRKLWLYRLEFNGNGPEIAPL